MPRSASNRTNSNSSQRRAPSPAPSYSPVPTIIHAPSHSPSPPSMVDTMKQGFSFGVGSAIANNLFRTNNKEESPKKMNLLMSVLMNLNYQMIKYTNYIINAWRIMIKI